MHFGASKEEGGGGQSGVEIEIFHLTFKMFKNDFPRAKICFEKFDFKPKL